MTGISGLRSTALGVTLTPFPNNESEIKKEKEVDDEDVSKEVVLEVENVVNEEKVLELSDGVNDELKTMTDESSEGENGKKRKREEEEDGSNNNDDTSPAKEPDSIIEKIDNVDNLMWGTVKIGKFIAAVIKFILIAFVLFALIKAANSMKKKEAAAPAEPSSTDKLLIEIRDALKK